MEKKYKLTKKTKDWFGTTLYQIEAIASFGSIVKGELGGYIEKEENLAQSGNAWVYGDAWVSGNAQVSGNAWVSGDAQVWGKLKLTLGYFFGLRYKKEEIKYVKLDDDHEIICKGDVKVGETDDKKTALLQKAEELISKANELKAEAEKL